MNEIEINKLIAELEKEIRVAKNEEDRSDALSRLQDIARDYAGDDKVVSSLEIAAEMKTRPEQVKMISGIGGLDRILEGFRHKQLIVLSAITKHGKTTFAIDLTARLKEYNPLWLPFEEPAEELIQKFIDRGEQPPLFYAPQKMSGSTLFWIEKKIIEAKAKYNSQLIFIDHLHYIIEMGGESVSHQIGVTMRSLKKLAVKWNVVIILIAHLTKTRLDENPNLENLRDSSFIAQEADTVVLLWRQTTKSRDGEVTITNNLNVSVQANRRTGKTGNVKMTYQNGKFFENNWNADADKVNREVTHWGK